MAQMRRILLVLAMIGLGIACGERDNGQEVDFKVPVSVEEVGLGNVEDRIVATGTLRAEEIVTLAAESAGTLEIARSPQGRRLGEGDRVVAGQVIARITGEDARLAARTEATRQRFAAAESDFKATRELFDQGLITETELRNSATALEEARLEFDRSRRTEARNQLTTPISGMILSLARDVNGQTVGVGQLVAAGFVVATVAPTSQMIADVDLVGSDLAKVHEGQEARVRHYAFAGREFSGQVVRLAPTIDSVTRALRAEVEVDNSTGDLRPGMFVEVSLVGERRIDVPVLPRRAVTDRAGKRVVFVLRGQRVARRELELGLGDDEIVEVISGVEPGERVVTRGLETLKDNMRVRVTTGS